jgi:hypothetical protein
VPSSRKASVAGIKGAVMRDETCRKASKQFDTARGPSRFYGGRRVLSEARENRRKAPYCGLSRTLAKSNDKAL